MVRNYLKVGLRSLLRHRVHSVLNLVGLTVGLAVFLFVVAYVLDDLAYDRFHDEADDLFRIAAELKVGAREIRAPLTPGPLAGALVEELPQVEAACRIHRREGVVRHDGHAFLEERLLYVDPAFFELFGFPLRGGGVGSRSPLSRPDALVLGSTAATRYFGARDPVGRTLVLDGRPHTVTAVVESSDVRSHLEFDLLAPLASLEGGPWIESWLANNVYTYVELDAGAESRDLEGPLQDLVAEHAGPRLAHSMGTTFEEFLSSGGSLEYFLQPVPDIHLHSDLEHELAPTSDGTLVVALSGLALFVLLLACVNYMNLATALAGRRSLEVGIRKSLGAQPEQVAAQFVAEAVLLTAVAVALAVGLLLPLLPWLGARFGKELAVGDLIQGPLVLGLSVLILVVGAVAGSYPGIFLARLRPIQILRGGLHRGRGGNRLRQALVVFQFVVAAALIGSALVIHQQVGFLLRSDLGYEPEGVLVVERARALGPRWAGFLAEVATLSGVESASAASGVPGRTTREVYYNRVGSEGSETETAWLIEADGRFLETLGISLVAGRSLSALEEERSAVWINRLAAERMGLAEPIGEQLVVPGRPRQVRIAGILGDFHVQSLRRPLKPTLIRSLDGEPGVIALRYRPGEAERVVAAAQDTWRRFAPEEPFLYTFLDQEVALAYREERSLRAMVSLLAGVAVLVACVGIYGLATYSAAQRTKEIGVRKVFGASIRSVALLLSKDYLRLVAVALVLALPSAWYGTSRWLETFAYRIHFPVEAFGIAALLTLFASSLSVTYRSIRAAAADPVKSLRYE